MPMAFPKEEVRDPIGKDCHCCFVSMMLESSESSGELAVAGFQTRLVEQAGLLVTSAQTVIRMY